MYDSKLGDKPFIDMMHDFVSRHTNGNATTESFQRVVEQHMRPVMDVAGNPIHLDFGGPVVQLGRAKTVGNTTVDIPHVPLPKQPKRVLINYWHDVLEQ